MRGIFKGECPISSDHLISLLSLFDGASSYGEDINYDPDFDIVKAEVGKLGNIDYELLEEKSYALIKQKSKDIRLFSFLGLCYLKANQWEKFCDVYDALGQLSQKDYNSLFPARPRAKQLSFKWLGEDRFIDAVESAKPLQDAHEHINRLIASLTIIKEVLDKEFPNGSPFPSKLYSTAQKWQKSTEPKKEEPAPAASPQPSPAVAASVSTAPKAAAASVSEALENSKDALEAVRKAAIFLIEKEPQNPSGYRLVRSVRWGSVEKAPPHEGGATRLEPPPPERRTFIHSLLGKGDYLVALDTVEKTFSSGPTHLWLDLQRIAYTAAAQLGAAYSEVSRAILLETALFSQRIPQIKDLTYSDGTPFCDPATQDWLANEVAGVLSSQNSGAGAAGLSDKVEEEKKEVNGLFAANKVDEALDFMMKRIAESGCERDNFRRRLSVASVMINAKRTDIALYVLEHLNDTIEKHSLHIWEPSLAVDALNLLLRSYSLAAVAKQGPAAVKLLEKREEIMKKLSYIDPKAAYKQKQ